MFALDLTAQKDRCKKSIFFVTIIDHILKANTEEINYFRKVIFTYLKIGLIKKREQV